jgi:membrane fusion protein, multidrug efflux system
MNQPNEMENAEPRKSSAWKRMLRYIRRHWIVILVAIIILAVIAIIFVVPMLTGTSAKKPSPQSSSQRPQPVSAVATKKADLDVYLRGLGTVTPANTVIVKSQVSGQLMSVNFKEGQIVKKNDVLAQIDPRPFDVQLMQAEGQLARDQALLKNAQDDLVRYKQLLAQDSIAVQQVTTQEALIKQYAGVVQTDRGQIANARLQLTYARIIAPISGRVGLKQIDPGNMAQVNDPNGVVVITQLQPITVVFAVPQDNLPTILKRMQSEKVLLVYADNQEGNVLLATGSLLAVDNQIDTTTGTVKLKALFDNKDNKLFPNQFVNVRLKVYTLRDATVMPAAAVQRGSIGTFAYVIKSDKTATVRQLKLGPTEGGNVAVIEGLEPGELVVTVGVDKLREGTKVDIVTPGSKDTSLQRKRASRDAAQKMNKPPAN